MAWKKKTISLLLIVICTLNGVFSVHAKSDPVNKNSNRVHQYNSFILNKTDSDADISTTYLVKVAAKANKYPTKWQYLPTPNRSYSKKAKKAGKQAFIAILSAFLGAEVIGARAIATSAAVGYGGYYFTNTDTQNVYFKMKYYYRFIAKAKPDKYGNYNNYIEMKRVTKISKYKSMKNGQTNTQTRKTNQIWCF